MYNSTIDFTLDTICPWTYLAKRRLDEALRRVRETDASSKVKFTINYLPYQLNPEASEEGEDKYEWYKKSKYDNSEEKMKMYTTLMAAYGVSAGISYKFGGVVANSLNAHRLIQYFQEEKGPEVADALVNSLYRQYFEEERHPSSKETLLRACEEAKIPAVEAQSAVEDPTIGLRLATDLIRRQKSDGIDAVPYIVIEGRRRDITLQGAKEVEEFVKALESIVKESG